MMLPFQGLNGIMGGLQQTGGGGAPGGILGGLQQTGGGGIPNLSKLGPQQMPRGFGVGRPQVDSLSQVPQATQGGPGGMMGGLQSILDDPQAVRSFAGLLTGGGQGSQAPQPMAPPNISVQAPRFPQAPGPLPTGPASFGRGPGTGFMNDSRGLF